MSRLQRLATSIEQSAARGQEKFYHCPVAIAPAGERIPDCDLCSFARSF